MTDAANYFARLSTVNVNEHIEKKGAFSYLSWPFAVSQLRIAHPTATWEVKRFDGLPYLKTDCGYFVEVGVTVEGVSLSQIHPVLDGKNRPIFEPTVFDINTSIQRCLVKAIALHGLGLYIYAGEDLPAEPQAANDPQPPALPAAPVRSKSDDLLTPAQLRYVHRLMAETGVTLERFRKFFGFESPELVTKADASRVIKALEGARRKEAA